MIPLKEGALRNIGVYYVRHTYSHLRGDNPVECIGLFSGIDIPLVVLVEWSAGWEPDFNDE